MYIDYYDATSISSVVHNNKIEGRSISCPALGGIHESSFNYDRS